MAQFSSIIMGGIFALVGLVVIILAVGQIQLGTASKSWPSTNGTVQVSSMTSSYGCHGKSGCYYTYVANIDYAYNVGGVQYSSGQLNIIGSASSRDPSYIQGLVNQYPVGESVQVYYNPATPSQAVLQPGVQSGSYALVVFGLIFALVGLFVAFKGATSYGYGYTTGYGGMSPPVQN